MNSTVQAGVAAPAITTQPPALLGTFALKGRISGEVTAMIAVVVRFILRMELMPFAQVATHIGGALTVTLAVIAMAHFKVQ